MQGSSGKMKAIKVGKKMKQVRQVDGTTKTLSFNLQNSMPQKLNLLSITALLPQGSNLTMNAKNNIVVLITNKCSWIVESKQEMVVCWVWIFILTLVSLHYIDKWLQTMH